MEISITATEVRHRNPKGQYSLVFGLDLDNKVLTVGNKRSKFPVMFSKAPSYFSMN